MSVVLYAFPTAGTVAPTVAVMKRNQLLTTQIGFLDADTTAVINHNWQSPLADGSSLFPLIDYYENTLGTAGAPSLTWALTSSVAVTVTKAAGAGTGGTITVMLQRPFSMLR